MKLIGRLIDKAIHEYDMLQAGDRVLAAVSGGKDSTTLAWFLAQRARRARPPFELRALHIATDFCSCCKRLELGRLLADWGVEYEELPVAVIGRLKPGRRMNCYWCSTQRRGELIRYARENGFNKIALGHHLDDIVETMFMNMLAKAEISTMPPLLRYRNYPVTIIRPLALVEERQIVEFAAHTGIAAAACTCPYGFKSDRRVIRTRLKTLTGGSSRAKRNLFLSMRNIDREYLT